MKKIYLIIAYRCMLFLLVLFGITGTGFAQSTANYAFTTNAIGSLVDMASATNVPGLTLGDDNASSAVTFPNNFEFWFMGTRYTQFSINTNGSLRLGGTAIGGATIGNSFPVSAQAIISPWAMDMQMRSAVNASGAYLLTGTAPNRVFVVEWKNVSCNYTSTSADINMQVLFYENIGKIEYRYGAMNVAAAAASASGYDIAAVGFSNTTGDNNWLTVNQSTLAVTTTGTPSKVNYAAATALPNFNGTVNGSRRVMTFTPPVPSVAPTNLTFASVTASGMTLNWTEPSPTTGIYKYAIYNSTDGGTTYNFVATTNVGTATYAATGLIPSTTYTWRVYAVSEGALSTPVTGNQATTAAPTYYYVGGATGELNNITTDWNTQADGLGTFRTAASTVDILIVDGAGTTPGAAVSLTANANASVGQLKVTSNTAATLQSSSTTTRTITITGGTGTDFDVQAGSALTMTNASNAAAIAFSGTGNTGTIDGTVNLSGSTSNTITSTGGTGTLVTVGGTGIVNIGLATAQVLAGSVATLNFANGAVCNVSGHTTGNVSVPSATWGATSNLNVSGGTTGTGWTSNSTSYGNVTYNSTTLTTPTILSAFTTGTITIQGNLNIVNTNTGKFRAVTSGTLTINGNLNISGGTFEVASAAGTVKLLGNLNQTGGTLDASGTTNSLEFAGTAAQTATIGTQGTGTLNVRINNAAGVSLGGTLNINNGGTLTVSNGNLSGSGTVAYNATSSRLTYNSSTGAQTASSVEFPAANGPVNMTINNTATAPNNTVTLTFVRSLPAAGVLTLTSGLLANGSNTFTLNNTATGAVTGASATSYVRGGLQRTLPASLATGTTYLFPVGKGGYNQMELVNATTNAGGTVVVKAEAVDGATGGTAGAGMNSISNTRYWIISATSGTANLISTTMRLYDVIGSNSAIGASNTLTGTYVLAGSPSTGVGYVAASGITSFAGYNVMGEKSDPPVNSNIAISPTGNQCTNVTRNVTVTVTPGAVAITGVVINYSVNGTAQTAITMTNSGGNNWSGTIPTVTPTNANVTWSITATDANNLSDNDAGTAYQDDPLAAVTNVTSSADVICSGNTVTLTAKVASPGTASSIGTSTSTTGNTNDVTAFGNRWTNHHVQMLFTVADLNAAGLVAGNITSMTFNILSNGSATTNANYTVKIGNAGALNALSAFQTTSSYTTVYPAQTYTHAVGANTINFSTPYNWDGTSNIVVDVASGGANSTYNAETYYTTTATNTVYANYNSTTGAAYNTRPNVIFAGNVLQPATSVAWSDGVNSLGTNNPITQLPSTNTTYTASITSNGCTRNVTKTITVNQTPTPPVATNSTQCGPGVPTASVMSTAGSNGSGTFNWYDAPTGGNLVQSGSIYQSSLSATDTFYVSEMGNSSCSSSRTPVTVTVTTPPAVTATGDAAICPDSNLTLSVTSPNSDYTYTWTPGNLTGSSIIVSPSAATQYVVHAVDNSGGANNGCNTYDTVLVSVNAAPTAVTITPADTTICLGNVTQLTASGGTMPVTGAIGTGTGSASTTGYPNPLSAYYGGAKHQMIYTASELAAQGFGANAQITSVALDLNAYAANACANLTIRMKSTNSTVLSGFEAGTANVYGPATYTPSATGWVTFNLTTPFTWNGTDNIIIEFVHNAGNSGNGSGTTTRNSITTGNMTYYGASDNVAGGISGFDGLTSYGTSGATTSRPNVRLGGSIPVTKTWSPLTGLYTDVSATTPYAGENIATVYAQPGAGGSYEYLVSASNGTCSRKDTATVNVSDATGTISDSSDVTACGVTDGSITISGLGANTSYTLDYIVDVTAAPQATITTDGSGSYVMTGLAGGNYHDIVLSEVGGCTGAPLGPVQIDAPVAANISVANFEPNTDCVTPNGSMLLSATEFISGQVYAVYYNGAQHGTATVAGDQTLTIPGLVAAIYNDIHVISGQNCESDTVASFTVTGAPAGMIIDSFTYIEPTDCNSGDGSITLYGTFPNGQALTPMYHFNGVGGGSGFGVAENDTLYIGGLAPGTYDSIYISDASCPSNAVGSVVMTAGVLGGGIATNTSENVQSQGSDVEVVYTNSSCEIIAAVTSTDGDMGSVTAKVSVAAAALYNNEPYIGRVYDIEPVNSVGGTVTLYYTADDINDYNTLAAGTGNSNYPPIVIDQGTGSVSGLQITAFHSDSGVSSGPLGYDPSTGEVLTSSSVWNDAEQRVEVTFTTTQFSGFFAHSNVAGEALPIRIGDISAINLGDVNRVDWDTKDEAEGDRFVIERSVDARTFRSIGTIDAKGQSGSRYSFIDSDPYSGINYYRLQLLNNDGSKYYSKVVNATVRGNAIEIIAFPNPVSELLTIRAKGRVTGRGELVLTDVSGKVLGKAGIESDGTSVIRTGHLSAGTYLLKFHDDVTDQTIKISKEQ